MLNQNQSRAVDKLSKAGCGIAWHKIGTGKTRIGLAWAANICSGPEDKAVVICSPNAIRQWQDEAELVDFTRLEFLSYGELQTMYADRAVYRILSDPNIRCAIIDELWLFKNVKALRTKNVHKITSALRTIGLSGSLVTARNIEDLFGQSFAVNIHKAVAKNLTDFRTQFCISTPNFGGLKFWAKKDALETIQTRLAPYVDIYFPPPERESKMIRTTVDSSPEQDVHIEQVKSEYYTLFEEGELEIKNAAVLIGKLQQISDGAVITSEGTVAHLQSSKLERCIELCRQLADSGEKVLIWTAFKESLNLLVSRLGKETTTLSSHTKFDFLGWNRGQYKFCVATVGSGASLNDFANCQYAIVYSAPFNHRAVQQAFGRTNRKGSQHKIAYYYMMQTAGTTDKYVYNNLNWTAGVEQAIIATSTQVIQQWMEKERKLTSVK